MHRINTRTHTYRTFHKVTNQKSMYHTRAESRDFNLYIKNSFLPEWEDSIFLFILIN